jgi:hypothetical protein
MAEHFNNLCDLILGKEFSDMMPKAQFTKEKMAKSDFRL